MPQSSRIPFLPAPGDRWPSALALFLAALQFLYLPFFGNINGTAKQFALTLFTLGAWSFFLGTDRRIFLPRVAPLLGLFFLALFFSAWQASYRYDALIGVACVGAGLLFLLLIYNAAIRCPSLGERLMGATLLSGVLASALGLYQYASYRLSGVNYSDYGRIKGMLIPYILPPLPNMRITGAYGHSSFLALLLIVCLLSFFYRYAHCPRSFSVPFLAPLRFVPVLLVGVVFFLTQSRSTILSLFVVMALLAYLIIKGRYPDDRPGTGRELFLLGLSLLAAFAIFKLVSSPELLSDLFSTGQKSGSAPASAPLMRSETLSGHNVESRLVHYLTAVLIFLDHPWLGVGLDNLKSFLSLYQLEALDLLHFEYEALEYTRWSHNEFLQILCEGGILPALLLLLLFGLFCFSWYRKLFAEEKPDAIVLYGHLLIVPFIVQSCFSWSLRYPPLQAIFLALVGVLLSFHGGRTFSLSSGGRRVLALLSACAILVTGLLLRQEVETSKVLADLRKDTGSEQNLEAFEALVYNPYNEYFALRKMVPSLVTMARKEEGTRLAERVLPMARRMTEIEGAYFEWYNLSLLSFATGRKEESRRAVEKAIERRPVYDRAWTWLHYLNMVDASEAIGVPLEEFLERGAATVERINGGD